MSLTSRYSFLDLRTGKRITVIGARECILSTEVEGTPDVIDDYGFAEGAVVNVAFWERFAPGMQAYVCDEQFDADADTELWWRSASPKLEPFVEHKTRFRRSLEWALNMFAKTRRE
jgi:hypothetical protein